MQKVSALNKNNLPRKEYKVVVQKALLPFLFPRRDALRGLNPKIFLPAVLIILFLFMCIFAYADTPPAIVLTASWYSMDSLKKEGTFKYSKGVMANGKLFDENALTCACRLYPLGTLLRVTNISNGKSIVVRVTDRIGIRFARTRIDLSKSAFQKICNLDKGLCKVKVEVIK